MHQRLGSGIQDVPLDTHGASKRGIESRWLPSDRQADSGEVASRISLGTVGA